MKSKGKNFIFIRYILGIVALVAIGTVFYVAISYVWRNESAGFMMPFVIAIFIFLVGIPIVAWKDIKKKQINADDTE